MNPWLERPGLWGSIHARLIVALADDLNPRLRPTYQAEVEEMVYIDLLRAYAPLPLRWLGESQPGHYRILVSRANHRPRAELYPFNVREPVPLFQLPLRANDDEPVIDLGLLLREMYDRANYDLTIDYRIEPDPPLAVEDVAWVEDQLKLKT